MIVAAQTRSYDTAMQLGQKSVRYVTALIMEQAVRAPAIMQDLISGHQETLANPRYRPATIREIHEEEEVVRPQIDLSDDEMIDDTPAVENADLVDSVESVESVESVVMEVSGGSEDAGASGGGGVGVTSRRGRRKKVPADLTFSSGRSAVQSAASQSSLYRRRI